jgi:Uma2 family endonuclease
MTAAMSENPPVDGWTADDLERFPEDNTRRELLDGVLLASPSPSFTHQKIAFLLAAALDSSCPPEYEVNQDIDVRFGERVHTHKIDPRTEVYRPTGTFKDLIDLEEPWGISIPISRLTPRHFPRG